MKPNNKIQFHYTRFSDLLERHDLYYSYLSADELIRAKRFYFPEDQQRFTMARGYLRELLATYLKVDPEDVQFAYGEQDKPYLPEHTLQFNLSHTREALLIALSEQKAVGVDLELTTRDVDIEGLARHSFSAAEQKYLNSVPASQKNQAFFRCWARKEAFLKALGIGIAIELNSITTTKDEQENLLLDYAGQTWQVLDLPPRDQHCLALAVEV